MKNKANENVLKILFERPKCRRKSESICECLGKLIETFKKKCQR